MNDCKRCTTDLSQVSFMQLAFRSGQLTVKCPVCNQIASVTLTSTGGLKVVSV